MALFISYSSQDRSSLDALTTALRRAQQQVWLDQELGGGDSWWNKILEKIRSCEVFIVALSNQWLQSKPCQAELRYAQALKRPILPVRVGPLDNVRVNPVATLQIVDYQNPTVESGIQLITALHALQTQAPPLPSPLPEDPPVPFGYLMRLGNTLTEKELTSQQQLQLLVELKSGLDEDGDDPSARSDIAQLLRMLRMRHDVTYRTRSEIDAVLASIDANTPVAAGTQLDQRTGRAAQSASTAGTSSPPATAAKSNIPTQSSTAATVAGRRPSATPSSQPPARDGGASHKRLPILGGGDRSAAADTKRRGRRRVWIAAALVCAVLLVAGGAVLAVRLTGKPSGAPGASAGPPSGLVPASAVEALLLGADQVHGIVGQQLQVVSSSNQTIDSSGGFNLPDCSGAIYPLESPVYTPTRYTAVRGSLLQPSPTGNPFYPYVDQSVALLSSADRAAHLRADSKQQWQNCAGKPLTVSSGNSTMQATLANVVSQGDMISQNRTVADGASCQHTMGVWSNVVAEAVVCADTGVGDESQHVVEAILANARQP
jgi:hypothetical protein